MRNVDNSLWFLGTVLCLAVAGAALCETGRHWDAPEAQRAKEGLWGMTRKSSPESQKGLCWGASRMRQQHGDWMH